MSRNQWMIVGALGLATAMVFGCLGALGLLYLTGGLTLETSAPVPPVDTSMPRPTNTPTPPRESALCQSQTQDYLAEIEPLLDEWLDVVEVAQSTARIGLSPLVREMQESARDIAELPVPDCAQEASGLLMIGLDAVTDSFLDFMADTKDETAIEQEMSIGFLEIGSATDQLNALAIGVQTDHDDDGYASCADRTLGEAQRLSGETSSAFSRAARDGVTDFCRQLRGWQTSADGLRSTYGACPVPADPHLQVANMWLEMGYARLVDSMLGFDEWCAGSSGELSVGGCGADHRCSVALKQIAVFELSITKAKVEIDRFRSGR